MNRPQPRMITAGQLFHRFHQEGFAHQAIKRRWPEIGDRLVSRDGDREVIVIDVFLRRSSAPGPQPAQIMFHPVSAIFLRKFRVDDAATQQRSRRGGGVEVLGAHHVVEAGAVEGFVPTPVPSQSMVGVAHIRLGSTALGQLVGHGMHQLAGGVRRIKMLRQRRGLAFGHQPRRPVSENRVFGRPWEGGAVDDTIGSFPSMLQSPPIPAAASG